MRKENESVILFLSPKRRKNRKTYTLIAAVAVGVGCILVCADSLGNAGIAPWQLLGLESYSGWNDCWLDFWDMLSEGVMMPLGALLMSLMIGWEIGPEVVKEECEATPGHKMGSYGFFKICKIGRASCRERV